MGHDLFDSTTVALDILLRKLSRSCKQFKPTWAFALRAGFGSPQKVPFGDYTNEISGPVNYGQSADVILQHQPYRFENGRVRRDRDDPASHDIAGFHGDSSIRR
jgi:hypothetical protein